MASELTFSWSNPSIEGSKRSKRFGHGMVTVGDKVYIYGGGVNADDDRIDYKNDMFVLTISEELKWEKIAQKGEIPQAREGPTFWKDGCGSIIT